MGPSNKSYHHKYLTYVLKSNTIPSYNIYYGVDWRRMVQMHEMYTLIARATPHLCEDILWNIIDFIEAGWLPDLNKRERIKFYKQ